jgi:hypothetical protein
VIGCEAHQLVVERISSTKNGQIWEYSKLIFILFKLHLMKLTYFNTCRQEIGKERKTEWTTTTENELQAGTTEQTSM